MALTNGNAAGSLRKNNDLILLSEKKDFKSTWPWWRISFTGLNILALVLSTILSWHFLTGVVMAGCNGGSPCEQILSSRWSVIAGVIPVSGLAMGVYLAMLFAGLFIGPGTELSIRKLAWKVILVLAGSVTGGAIWFIILQKWVLGEFCIYCMITHITGLIISALVIWWAVKEFRIHPVSLSRRTNIIRPCYPAMLVFAGLSLAGMMVVSQLALRTSSVYFDGKSREKLPVVDYHDVPMIGSPNAPIVVTLLFDYQCTHCQRIHFMLDEVVSRYKGQLAFALCPTPLNSQCNKYIPNDVETFKNSCELTKTGLAIWKANREAFMAFENWMFTYESGDRWQPRSVEAARVKAIEMVGQLEFDTAWSDPWIDIYMQSCVRIFGQTLQNGKGGIPKMIYGSRWVIPEPQNAEELITVLQESLALPQP